MAKRNTSVVNSWDLRSFLINNKIDMRNINKGSKPNKEGEERFWLTSNGVAVIGCAKDLDLKKPAKVFQMSDIDTGETWHFCANEQELKFETEGVSFE